MGEAMKPLGSISASSRDARGRKGRSFRVMMVNDLYDAAKGALRLTLESEDGREARTRRVRSCSLRSAP